MSDGNSVFNRNPLGGRYGVLKDAHEQGRAAKLEQATQQTKHTWAADAKPAPTQSAERPPNYTDPNQAQQVAANRADLSRQVWVNAASVSAERHGTAATAPAGPIRKDAPPIEAHPRGQTQGRAAQQPTPGGTMFSTSAGQNTGRGQNAFTAAAQQPQGQEQPAQQKTNAFTTSLTKEDVARMAGMQQGRELDRGR